MPVVATHELKPGPVLHSQQIYNGLDCCLTVEIHQELERSHNAPNVIYDFERALQAPALEMMMRGFKVDETARRAGVALLDTKLEKLNSILQQLAFAAWGKTLNPRSSLQLQNFFYKTMRLPEQWISQKGVRKLSMNREVLEKLELYFHAKPFINCITAIRETHKLREVLTTEIDSDGRYRTSFNIGGTETGRWSSSKSSTGTGGNQQNWTRELRNILVADPGYKLCGIDLEQAESRELGWLVGTLFGDWAYYDACLAGDLHTITCRLVWPKTIPWTGDLKADRELAEQVFYRHFTYRDMSKRGGHGTNYYGTPHTMARHLKVSRKLIEEFQNAYFSAYPGIKKYHRWVSQQLGLEQKLTSVFGRERHFFGRPNDDTTLREAIAYNPQSATADRMNLVLWRLWKHMGNRIQLLAQVHDAVYFQFPESANEAEIVADALSHFHIDIKHGDRSLLVPGEAKTGWNWGDLDPKCENFPDGNPWGLKKFKGSDSRVRPGLLDRVMC